MLDAEPTAKGVANIQLDLSSAKAIADALSSASIPYAVGGSCLLFSLGLTDHVRDYDFTTDVDLLRVQAVLGIFNAALAGAGEPPFASAYRMTIALAGPRVDLIGRFGIRTTLGVCRLPSLPDAEWRGLRMASPEVWAVAYRLMGRHERANALSRYVGARGARSEPVQALLVQPLPKAVRREVEAW